MSVQWHGDTPVKLDVSAAVWDVVVITAPGRPGPDDEVSVGVVTDVSPYGEALRASRPGAPDWTREARPNSEVLVALGVDSRAVVGGLRLRLGQEGPFFATKADAALFLQPYRGDLHAANRNAPAVRPPLPKV